MKQVTRISGLGERVWLTELGHWDKDRSQAGKFEPNEAKRRADRLRTSEVIDDDKDPEDRP
jgi:hypothetical protein